MNDIMLSLNHPFFVFFDWLVSHPHTPSDPATKEYVDGKGGPLVNYCDRVFSSNVYAQDFTIDVPNLSKCKSIQVNVTKINLNTDSGVSAIVTAFSFGINSSILLLSQNYSTKYGGCCGLIKQLDSNISYIGTSYSFYDGSATEESYYKNINNKFSDSFYLRLESNFNDKTVGVMIWILGF